MRGSGDEDYSIFGRAQEESTGESRKLIYMKLAAFGIRCAVGEEVPGYKHPMSPAFKEAALNLKNALDCCPNGESGAVEALHAFFATMYTAVVGEFRTLSAHAHGRYVNPFTRALALLCVNEHGSIHVNMHTITSQYAAVKWTIRATMLQCMKREWAAAEQRALETGVALPEEPLDMEDP